MRTISLFLLAFSSLIAHSSSSQSRLSPSPYCPSPFPPSLSLFSFPSRTNPIKPISSLLIPCQKVPPTQAASSKLVKAPLRKGIRPRTVMGYSRIVVRWGMLLLDDSSAWRKERSVSWCRGVMTGEGRETWRVVSSGSSTRHFLMNSWRLSGRSLLTMGGGLVMVILR